MPKVKTSNAKNGKTASLDIKKAHDETKQRVDMADSSRKTVTGLVGQSRYKRLRASHQYHKYKKRYHISQAIKT